MKPERIVDGVFLRASAISFFTSMVFYLLLTTMALYAAERFNASDSIAGFSATAFILGAVAARISGTRMMRRWGRRRVIAVALVLSVVLVAAYPFATESWQLIAIRLMHGLAYGASGTLLVSGVLTRGPRGQRAQLAGYFGLPTTVAAAIGPFLAVSLLSVAGMDGIFIASTVLMVAAALPALWLRLPSGRSTHDSPPSAAVPINDTAGAIRPDSPVSAERNENLERAAPAAPGGPLPKAKLLGLGGVIFLLGVAYAGVIAYLVPYSVEIGAEWSAAAYFAAYAIVALLARIMLGRIQDRWGDNSVVYPMLLAFVLSMLLLGFAESGLLVVFAGMLMGLGFGMLLPTMQAAASRLVRDSQLNSAVVTVFVALDLGVGLAPLMLGLIIGQLGMSAMYLILAAVVVCAGVLYATGHGRVAGKRRR